jgi:methionyl-tRNA synthetase
MITIDDFKKVELRTAKVVQCDVHPNADRLWVLQVEVGAERRQIVAGIRGHYTAEQLVGKTVIVVANLQPAMLRGVESQGMLLAVRDGERVVALTTDPPTSTGLLVT